jgi:mevalonate kinase
MKKEEENLKASAFAPGKVILTGEHFVVYGEPALVMAINRNVKVRVQERQDYSIQVTSSLGYSGTFTGTKFIPEKGGNETQKILTPINISAQTVLNYLEEEHGLNIEVESNIPIAVGLGSSGALAVATVAAVGRLFGLDFTEEEIIKLSIEAEKFVHVNPSGIDQTISTTGGIMCYKRDGGASKIDIDVPIPIVIGNTRIKRNTGKIVDNVRFKRERFPHLINPLIHVAGNLTVQVIKALKQGDLNRIGELIDLNHSLLTAIGVSNELLDKLVHVSKQHGALGAKITGAGGGGCIFALSTLNKREAIAKAIHQAGGVPIIAEKVDKGVCSWIEQ